MTIRIIIECLVAVLLIVGLCFEEKIALWERRKLRNLFQKLGIGKNLKEKGRYPYDDLVQEVEDE